MPNHLDTNGTAQHTLMRMDLIQFILVLISGSIIHLSESIPLNSTPSFHSIDVNWKSSNQAEKYLVTICENQTWGPIKCELKDFQETKRVNQTMAFKGNYFVLFLLPHPSCSHSSIY
jgi:hypothetical protein